MAGKSAFGAPMCKGVVFLLLLGALSFASMTSADGVYCGRSNQICPLGSPICCGEETHFCVEAGYKCCGGDGNGRAAQCPQSNTCCPGETETLCCRPGNICNVDMWGNPSCIPNECSGNASPESCLSNENSGKCGWCCGENRCVPLDPAGRVLPFSGCTGRVLLSSQDSCGSRCYSADTCGQCTGRESGNSAEANEEECAWCCATMSCMPAKRVAAMCPNYQFTMSAESCVNCYHGGRGVSRLASSRVTAYSLISSFMLLLAMIGILVAVRVILSSCIEVEKPNAQQVQESVRRYGFTATDALPSSPIVHHRRGNAGGEGEQGGVSDSSAADTAEETATGGAAGAASAADTTPSPEDTRRNSNDTAESPFPRMPSRTALPRAATPAAGPSSESTAATEVRLLSTTACAACKKPIRLSALETRLASGINGGDRASAAHTRRGLGSASPSAPLGDDAAATEVKDDPAVIFLPCGHCCCYQCIGISPNTPASPPPAVSTAAPMDPGATAQAGAEASPAAPPPAAPAQPTIEELITKKRKGKCPACKKKFTDMLVTDKVRSI